MTTTSYGRVYTQLIEKAVTRETVLEYFETHHILPRSLGGTDIKSNLVALTYREHYIAHLLLYKHFKKLQDNRTTYKMALAVQLMKNGKVSSISSFKSKPGTSHAYQSIKEVISANMIGENNPMYGKPSKRKGKKWEDIYSKATIKVMREAATNRRTLTEKYTWVKDGIEEICDIHTLSEKYNLSAKHLSDIINNDTSRKLCYGWGLKHEDNRNKYVRKQSSVTFEFFRLENVYSITATIDDMLAAYPELSYKGLRNVVNSYSSGEFSHKSYKGWMLRDTYDERIALWSFHNILRVWVDKTSNSEFVFSIKQLSEVSKIDVGRLVEVVKGTRTSSKYKIKE